jgi:ferredoxin-NADP reductase
MTVVGRPLPERQPFPPGSLPATQRSRPLPSPNATLASAIEVTATLGVFTVVTDRPIVGFKPGQYVSLGMVDDPELVQRPYSIVSLSHDETRLEFFVRRLPDGRFSNLLWRQVPGTRLLVGPLKGLFTLDAEDRRPRVMVGTGTGLAPLLAMLESAAADGDHTPTVLVHGASFYAELAYGDRIAGFTASGLTLDYRPTVSRPHEKRNAGWSGRTGRVEAQVAALLEEWRWLRAGGSVAYLCGNPEMVSACRAVLSAAGFGERDIRFELFHQPLPERRAA